ncbi:capsule assembly Wzi family protein [Agaribacterium haliotis]|uniref:capsule assembly Wzi family protein n=1 Tax=Agaribacterium haliotis TaxID=2013869 RepID=UPI001EFD1D94|nr:capsule assembly Wzi family protein [Agaribacterium haliotis]
MSKAIKRHAKTLLAAALFFTAHASSAGSLYMPLNVSPEIDRRINELFVVAQMPQVKKPYPVKLIHQAMEKVEDSHPGLSSSVRNYLQRYSHKVGLSHVSAEIADGSGATYVEPNNRGYDSKSRYQVSANAYWVVNDLFAVNVGGMAGEREGDALSEYAEGSFLSIGSDWLQADIGYRSHWWSPLQDSAMLLSSQAAAMPGITLSNIKPLTDFGFSYEIFLQQMSESDKILSAENPPERLSGNPRLFGMHLGFAPFDGFQLGLNRLMQYGGADRDDSFNTLIKAFFQPYEQDNKGGQGNDFGNQVSSITVSYSFEHIIPIALSMEYAGEDTSEASSSGLLGNTSLLYGINLPRLGKFFALNWEHGEWQNAWYTNGNYGDGLRHWDAIIGHWGAEQRNFSQAVGASTDSLKLYWDVRSGTSVAATWRQVRNKETNSAIYSTGEEWGLELSQAAGEMIFNVNISAGQTVFDESFSRISGGLRW